MMSNVDGCCFIVLPRLHCVLLSAPDQDACEFPGGNLILGQRLRVMVRSR
jgi:hypothetical protein